MTKKQKLTAGLWAVPLLLILVILFDVNKWLVILVGAVLIAAPAILFRSRSRKKLAKIRNQGIENFRVNSRWLFPFAASAGFWHLINHNDQFIEALIIAIVFGLLIWPARRIDRARKRSAPYAANMPGVPRKRRTLPKHGRGLYTVIWLAGLAGVSLLTLIPNADLVLWLWGSVGAVLLAVLAHQNLYFGRNMRLITQAVAGYQPVFALPHDGTALFHLEMWTPYFIETGLPFIQITTNLDTFEKRASSSSLPIVAPTDLSKESLQAVLPKTLKAAFYPRNGTKNIKFIKLRRDLTHVFLHHGDGDKPASSSKRSAQYDVLAVAGEAAIDRYAMRGIHIPREKFKILGRPQVSNILEASTPIGEIRTPTVAYAPTWKGINESVNFSSLHVGPEIIQELLSRHVRVIFRPHAIGQNHPPHASAIAEIKRLLQEDQGVTGTPHVWGTQAEQTWDFADVANESDMLIADVSGVITDYMQSGKPFAMVSTKVSREQFLLDYPSSNSAYVIESEDLTSLPHLLDDALGVDSMKQKRLERREYYLGGYTGQESPAAFVNYLHELVGTDSRRASMSSAA